MKRKARTVIFVIADILLMATAWTVCVIAPMPWKVIVPITIGTISIIIKTLLLCRGNDKERKSGNKKGSKKAAAGKRGKN